MLLYRLKQRLSLFCASSFVPERRTLVMYRRISLAKYI
jgi:hypothetical protein